MNELFKKSFWPPKRLLVPETGQTKVPLNDFFECPLIKQKSLTDEQTHNVLLCISSLLLHKVFYSIFGPFYCIIVYRPLFTVYSKILNTVKEGPKYRKMRTKPPLTSKKGLFGLFSSFDPTVKQSKWTIQRYLDVRFQLKWTIQTPETLVGFQMFTVVQYSDVDCNLIMSFFPSQRTSNPLALS
jgi:hypothetical protein